MPAANILLVLAVLPLFAYLLWPIVPVRSTPRWVAFLPAAGLVLLVLHLLISGFHGSMLGVYLFAVVLFLLTLKRLRGLPVKERRRPAAIIGGLLLVFMLAVNLVPSILMPPDFATVKPSGEFGIGTVAYGWEDTSRPENFTEDPADHRKIAVQFWYPTDGKPGKSLENAPISAAQPTYPVVVFSHGAFGVRSSNTSTYQELASRGYIVASIDHTYHAFFTDFPEGQKTIVSQDFLAEVQLNQSSEISNEENYLIAFKWLDLRNADIRFTMDQIEALHAGSDGPLAGHVDLEKFGLFGHSLGGAASAAVCRIDERCKAVAVIDGTMFGEFDPSVTDRTMINDPFPAPLMIFYNGDTFYATPDHQGYEPDIHAFENAAAPAYSVVVNGAQHLNFTDLPTRAPILANMLGSMMTVNGGTAGEIDSILCLDIMNSYVADFFDQALLGKPSALLTSQSPYPQVEFTSNGQ